MIRRPPRSTLSSSSAASDVYKRQPDRNRQQPRRRRVVRGGGCPAARLHGTTGKLAIRPAADRRPGPTGWVGPDRGRSSRRREYRLSTAEGRVGSRPCRAATSPSVAPWTCAAYAAACVGVSDAGNDARQPVDGVCSGPCWLSRPPPTDRCVGRTSPPAPCLLVPVSEEF